MVEGSDIPKFRCTCYRSGNHHSFSSMDAARLANHSFWPTYNTYTFNTCREVGGLIQDKFKWKVQMKGFDVEVVLNVDSDQVYYGIKLTKESLFKRNIEHFGPTTLRATICSALLKVANVQPGDVVVDPMCGGGSIPIEGMIVWDQIETKLEATNWMQVLWATLKASIWVEMLMTKPLQELVLMSTQLCPNQEAVPILSTSSGGMWLGCH